MTRLNRRLAQLHPDISRRRADALIAANRVYVNQRPARLGQTVHHSDDIYVRGYHLQPTETKTILLNKPAGYIVSRTQQGSAPTVYDLLPDTLQHLHPIGRLDKPSRGLLLLSTDGALTERLTHPRYQKTKIYHVTLDDRLPDQALRALNQGVELEDGCSRLQVQHRCHTTYEVRMHEGRYRQIRRTIQAVGYQVHDLLRVQFGDYHIGETAEGAYRFVSTDSQTRN